MNQLYIDIFYNGIFYPDTCGRYIKDNVACDRCKRHNLKSCIGWKTHDLCMQCVAYISELIDDNFFDK